MNLIQENMSNIPPIQDTYIDNVIKSAGPLKPNLNKTQGIELRALVKLLRDRLESEIAEHYAATQAMLVQKIGQSEFQTGLENKISFSEKGQANGVATLDTNGKIPVSQLSEAIIGSVNYQGNYDAGADNPQLPAATGNKGKYYIITVAGNQQGLELNPGDWIISNGDVWQKVDNSAEVVSVNGMTGAVNITDITGNAGSANVSEGLSVFHPVLNDTIVLDYDQSDETYVIRGLNTLGNGSLRVDGAMVAKTITAYRGSISNVPISENDIVRLGDLSGYCTLSSIEDNFLPLTGGTLTGNLTVKSGLFFKSSDLNNTFYINANNDGSFIIYNDATGGGMAMNTAGLYNPNNNRKYVQERTDVEFNGLNVTGNANIGSAGSLTTINSFGLEENKPLYLSTPNHYLSTAANISFGNGDLAVNREGVGFKRVLLQGDALPLTGGQLTGNISVPTLNNLTIDFNKGGTFNTRIGVDLFGENIIGSSNVAIGQAVLKSLNDGVCNLGIGDYAGANLTKGFDNVVIGANALRGSSETNSAVAIGKDALTGSGNYSNSVAIGSGAGINSNGSSNVYLGSHAGAGNTGSGNVFIGFHAGFFYTNPMSNKFIISNGQFENEGVLIKGDFVTNEVEVQKLSVSERLNLTNGDIVINDFTKGVILKSPNGTHWRISVSDSGVLTTAPLN